MKNVVILHGALGSKSQFQALETYLSPHVKVWLFDFNGHGNDSCEAEFSIEQFATSTHNFLQQHGIENCVVFGYSMGGYVALHLERSKPKTFEQIVTLGTKFDWHVSQAEKEAGFLNPEQLEANLPAYANYLKELHGENKWKQVVEKTALMMRNMGANPPLRDADFKQINTPVILLRGTKDRMVSEEETKHVSEALNHATHIEIEHWQHPIDRIEVDALAKQLIKQVLK